LSLLHLLNAFDEPEAEQRRPRGASALDPLYLGAVALLLLIVVVLWRMLRIGGQSPDTFGRFLAAGVAAVIFFQSVISVGMNLGLMPVTGIPLPFVSYGGSSLLTLMLGLGLAESVAMRHKKLEFD
jgi:rod shape determining protein RodA